ncbi:unnamed protein product [Enterobius vermicularis]|uniref:MMS19 nucleotide excision repair protein n=1 Tax=Enterobius vermicularis TaxID=51028 RepID=A0A158QAL7_ENTVE|nr:unnamed protein product [Enterobius vermicularis]
MATVAEALQKIVNEKTWRLSNLIESQRSSLTSDKAEDRRKALEFLSGVISKLPEKLLLGKEGCVLSLNFVVQCIHQFPFGSEYSLFTTIFSTNHLQELPQNDRLKALQILLNLLEQDREAFLSFNDELILGFIQSSQGEADPRCLMVKDKSVITRDMLVEACEECLLSNQLFGSFTYQLIVEKILDDDVREPFKIEVCSFMSRACSTFSPATLRDQLDDVLGSIRMVAFNPSSKNAGTSMPLPVLKAIEAIISCLSSDKEEGTQSLIELTDNLLENCEPFVLEADLGLTKRALELFEAVARCSKITSGKILEAVFKWLFLLLSGTKVHTITDQQEVVSDSVEWLLRWCKVAIEIGNTDMPLQHYQAFMNVLRDERSLSKTTHFKFAEVGEVNAFIATYSLALFQLYLPLISGSEFDFFCRSLFVDCVKYVGDPNLRSCFLAFVHELAQSKWNFFVTCLSELLSSMSDEESVIAICCASIHDTESMAFAFPHIVSSDIFLSPVRTSFILSNILKVFLTNKSKEALCMNFFESLVTLLCRNYTGKCTTEVASALQDIGLTFSSKTHSKAVLHCADLLKERTAVVEIFYLLFLQCQEVETLQNIILLLGMDEIFCRYRMLLATTIINRASSDPEKAVDYSAISNKINFEENFWWRGRLCKMLLLRNYEGGVCLLQQLFCDLNSALDFRSCRDALCDILDYESRESNPEKSFLLTRKFIIFLVDADDWRSKCHNLLPHLLAFAEGLAPYVLEEFKKLLRILQSLVGSSLDSDVEESVLKALSYHLNTNPQLFDDSFICKATANLKSLVVSGKTTFIEAAFIR